MKVEVAVVFASKPLTFVCVRDVFVKEAVLKTCNAGNGRFCYMEVLCKSLINKPLPNTCGVGNIDREFFFSNGPLK